MKRAKREQKTIRFGGHDVVPLIIQNGFGDKPVGIVGMMCPMCRYEFFIPVRPEYEPSFCPNCGKGLASKFISEEEFKNQGGAT